MTSAVNNHWLTLSIAVAVFILSIGLIIGGIAGYLAVAASIGKSLLKAATDNYSSDYSTEVEKVLEAFIKVNPVGAEIIAEGGRDEPELLVATLELDDVVEAQRSLPWWRDRRPDLYAGLQAT